MEKYKIKCCINDNKVIEKPAKTLELAEELFYKFLNSPKKGQIEVFLLENFAQDKYSVKQHKVIVNN
jgi:hypothetical protein